ncbi:MAG: TIR domain-containing protein [Muribaculaceae bacterium]|nr:TIR domain-containing protein [Muribaculaceae bacterium]
MIPPARQKEAKIQKIVENLIEMKDVVVPIVGDDIFRVQTPGGPLSIHEYLLKRFTDEYGDAGMTDDDRALIVRGEFYGLSKLERFFPTDFETDYRLYIRQARKDGLIRMDDTVRAFLEAFRFPVIVTTTCFDFIEGAVGAMHYATRAYSPNGVNVAPLDPAVPTVYHIFGTISDGAQWVYNEDKLLEFLHALHNSDTTSVALKKYIDTRNCRLLALGCNLPDWLFRFLWYPLKSNATESRQTKGYWINERKMDESFNDFLDNIKFYSANELREILSQAAARQTEIEASSHGTAAAEAHFDAFLSYASEDKHIARRVFDILQSRGYRIWFDKDGSGKIEAGSNYMKKIEAGVAGSTYYIPLVTGNFLAKVCNPESNLKKELDIVRAHYKGFASPPERYSIPIIVKGSTFNDNAVTDSLVESMAAFILPKPLFQHINMYLFDPSDSTINLPL